MDKQHWTERAAIQQSVRERDRVCRGCGLTNEQSVKTFGAMLDVHRLDHSAPYTVEGCVALCKSCHGALRHSPGRATARARRLPPFATKLRSLREQCELTRRELSLRSGVGQEAVAAFERGYLRPTAEEARQLALCLNVPASTFPDSWLTTRRVSRRIEPKVSCRQN